MLVILLQPRLQADLSSQWAVSDCSASVFPQYTHHATDRRVLSVIAQEVTAILERPWGFKVHCTDLIWSGRPFTAIKKKKITQNQPTKKTQSKKPSYTSFLLISKRWVWRLWKTKLARKSTTKSEFYHLFCNTYTKWGVSLLFCNVLFFKVIKASQAIKLKYHMSSDLFLWRFF